MASVKKVLLSESVKFIELCQGNVLSGKINIETYNLLSNMKIKFLRNFLKEEVLEVNIDRDFSKRINNLFVINNMLQYR